MSSYKLSFELDPQNSGSSLTTTPTSIPLSIHHAHGHQNKPGPSRKKTATSELQIWIDVLALKLITAMDRISSSFLIKRLAGNARSFKPRYVHRYLLVFGGRLTGSHLLTDTFLSLLGTPVFLDILYVCSLSYA